MAGLYDPGSCDESDEDSASKKTTPPWSNPPSPEISEREFAPLGRGRGRGRAMDDRVDLTQEDVHRVRRQTARQRVQEEIEERDHHDDEDDDDDDQVRRDSRAKGIVYEVRFFKGQSCSSPRCYSICVKKT